MKLNKVASVYICEDHWMIRDSLESMLFSTSHFELVGQSMSVRETLTFLKERPVDILILDINLPDGNGLDLIPQVKAPAHPPQILMLSMYNNPNTIEKAFTSGANGFINKVADKKELLYAIETVSRQKVYKPEVYLRARQNQSQQSLLTRRELEIVKQTAWGNSARIIAGELFISEATVKTHLKNIYKKLNINSNKDLIKFAYEENLY